MTRNRRKHRLQLTRKVCVDYIQSSLTHIFSAKCGEIPSGCWHGRYCSIHNILSVSLGIFFKSSIPLPPSCAPALSTFLSSLMSTKDRLTSATFSFHGSSEFGGHLMVWVQNKPFFFFFSHNKCKATVSSLSFFLEYYMSYLATRENVALKLFELASAGQQSCLWKN